MQFSSIQFNIVFSGLQNEFFPPGKYCINFPASYVPSVHQCDPIINWDSHACWGD